MPEDIYWSAPQADGDARRRLFLEFAAQGARGGHTGFFSQIARLDLGLPIDESRVREAIAHVDARRDCGDFAVAGLLRIAYQYADSPLLSRDLLSEIKRCLLNFKYWIDEPGKEMMCFWSENHQIMFHADEYLAGQLLPDEVFPNDGRTGRQHAEHGRRKLLRWADLRVRAGFSEWDSNCYYDEDLTPLLNLCDFAEDAEVAQRATMLIDLMLFDIACDSFRGVHACSHGRTYPRLITGGRGEASIGLQKIAWGMGLFNNPSNMTAVSLATSRRYRIPPAIQAAAQDLPAELLNRERHSLVSDDPERYGLDPDDLDDHMLMFGAAKFAHRKSIEMTLRMADAYRSHRFSVVILPYARALYETYNYLDERGIPHDGDLDRFNLSEVNKMTYRTPDYMLACAQDYRKGKTGFQQHIWQATLGLDAVVFTLHRSDENETNYKHWVGRFPRAVQHKNLLIALYNVPERPVPGPRTVSPPDAGGNAIPSPAPSEELLLPYTCAYFPRSAFDETLERDGWILARKGDGYLALRSQRPHRWMAEAVFQQEGLRVDGRRNAYICHLGRRETDGAFERFAERIARSRVEFGDLTVRYDAPGLGEARVAWDGPFTINGAPVPLRDYARFDNPYCRAEFGTRRFEIACAGRRLTLDFDNLERVSA
ncbi:MAG: hypothetical protein A3F84_12755 [Candidatus Handelsmanbacteria bacterium RIFCSPLOWO2_12_FULL_64_10]|uniref:Uncharacterized protein n=1 Tax=Handelsmanbacteria sp. (strain RIFCSPLOWO2_12_FULL_64_10) TaxID=1817868 RepID=A0A1F6CFN4_HANXR|nr:MAG: hypothetical protein A3F84_12755 [Candidatus Handelsmanbacteria bacterium RIFCSPLOWO2_12_FULL_64_10]